jgi:hypothetical protein
MIERAVTSAMIQAAKATPSRLLAFFELDFPSGWVRVHSGLGTRIYNGESYIGIGELGGMGTVTENASTSGNRTTLTLKVTDQSLLAEAMNEDPAGRDCFGHLVAFDEDRQIIDGADYFIDAEMVDMTIKRGKPSAGVPAVINITINDWLERWAQPVEIVKTTDQAQQFLYPGDRFFDLVEIIAGSPLSSLPVKTNYGTTSTRTTKTGRYAR